MDLNIDFDSEKGCKLVLKIQNRITKSQDKQSELVTNWKGWGRIQNSNSCRIHVQGLVTSKIFCVKMLL